MEECRRARFRREPDRLGFTLTERDQEIVRLVAQHRYLRSKHAVEFFGSRSVLYRLQGLYHHGYLERVRIGREDGRHGGGAECVYRLARRGAESLKDASPGRLTWLVKGEKGRRAGIEHALLISDLMVGLGISCRTAGVRLEEKPTPRVAVRAWHQERPWWLSVIPDRAFVLGEGATETLFLLEADRGTMPVRRRGLRQSSVFRKLLGYFEAWRQLIFERRHGFKRVRVLVVTTNAERAKHLVEVCRGLNSGRGSGLFLFAEAVGWASGNVLGLELRSGRGETTTLGSGIEQPVVKPVANEPALKTSPPASRGGGSRRGRLRLVW